MSVLKNLSMKNRVVVVTGGAGHIGFEVAKGFAELGANVVISDLTEDRCSSKAKELEQFGGQHLGIPTDLENESHTREMIKKTVSHFGRLDCVFHCAALVGTSQLKGWGVPFEQQSAETWDKAMVVNLRSGFVLAQEAAPHLRKSPNGNIIFVASTYALVGPDHRLYDGTPMGNPSAYGASKAGLLQFARYLATSLAPDIRVNCLTPGGVERGQPSAFQERYIFRTPLKRMANEQDMVGAAVYLASDLAKYVTGHNLVVDGGWTAW